MGMFNEYLQPPLANSMSGHDESQELVESEYMNTNMLREQRPQSKMNKSGHQSSASNASKNLQDDQGLASRDELNNPYENEAFIEKCKLS